jgi:LmbE family N-acetylglucosaminyl deacetylase
VGRARARNWPRWRPDTLLPSHWEEVKRALRTLREQADPDVILAPSAHDAHQDHHTLARLVPTTFRDHLTLGYEILKWEGDLHNPTVYLPMSEPVLQEKIVKLHEHYGSQRDRGWFDPEAFGGLARIRGVQCHARYAEAFHVAKLTLGVAVLGGYDPVD